MNKALTTIKMSELKKALNLVASLQNSASDEHKALANALKTELQDNKHIVELRDTTSCVMFIRDEHNNVLFNVYDTFRIQFTTQQAKKYADELLKDKRFYTFNYKQKQFISAKSKDIKEFIELCKYCYKVIDTVDNKTVEKATTTVSRAKQDNKKAK